VCLELAVGIEPTVFCLPCKCFTTKLRQLESVRPADPFLHPMLGGLHAKMGDHGDQLRFWEQVHFPRVRTVDRKQVYLAEIRSLRTSEMSPFFLVSRFGRSPISGFSGDSRDFEIAAMLLNSDCEFCSLSMRTSYGIGVPPCRHSAMRSGRFVRRAFIFS